ncbi:hypothetical protein A2U01_0073259, partial [Trifolium medium]|nr:hypothetical protein [Trifolium medium]
MPPRRAPVDPATEDDR